jgi:hypothetical protein
MSVKLSVERDFDTLGEFEASTEGDESTWEFSVDIRRSVDSCLRKDIIKFVGHKNRLTSRLDIVGVIIVKQRWSNSFW